MDRIGLLLQSGIIVSLIFLSHTVQTIKVAAKWQKARMQTVQPV